MLVAKNERKSFGDPVVGAGEVSIEIGVKEMLFEDPERIHKWRGRLAGSCGTS